MKRMKRLENGFGVKILTHRRLHLAMTLVRTFQRRRGRLIQLVSVPGYHRAEGGDAIFQLLSSPPRPAHPPVVLMESFDCGDSATAIVPGGAIPYGDGDVLAAAGVERGRALVEDPTFRRAWSAEAVAVWSALRIGSEVSLHVSRRSTPFVEAYCCIAAHLYVLYVDVHRSITSVLKLPPSFSSRYASRTGSSPTAAPESSSAGHSTSCATT